MVWKVLLAAVVFIGLCVVGLCFNILFRKGGKFPESDIGRNPELRKRGIRCVGEDEASLPGGSVDVSGGSANGFSGGSGGSTVSKTGSADGSGASEGCDDEVRSLRRTLPEGFDCGTCTACDLYKFSKKSKS